MTRGRGPRSPANATPRKRPARSRPAEKGGPRRVRPLRGKPTPSDADFEDRSPNLAAERRRDRLLRIKAARSMGATRKQASRHAAVETGDH